jgi:hypothetical protein
MDAHRIEFLAGDDLGIAIGSEANHHLRRE